jgi:hypothetical protein
VLGRRYDGLIAQLGGELMPAIAGRWDRSARSHIGSRKPNA